MAQIIVVHANKTVRDLLNLNLKAYTGAEVINRDSLNDAAALLEILPEIDILIYSPSRPEDAEKNLRKLVELYEINSIETQAIVLCHPQNLQVKLPAENFHLIKDPLNWEEAIDLASKILGVTLETLKKKVLPDYIPIAVDYFLPLENTPCDVYIRIKKAEGDYQFVKRMHATDSFSKETIERYKSQGLKFFYIPKEFQMELITFISNVLVEKLDAPDLPPEDRLNLTGEGYVIAKSEIIRMGLNNSTIQLAEAVITSMVKSIENSPELAGTLTKILNSKTGILYQMSHLTTLLSFQLLDSLQINTEENRQKIVYAAFFCDMALVDREDLCFINSFEELDEAKLPSKEWDMVFNHALDGAIFVRKYPDAPIGVDTIIKEHHGSPQGKGYSRANYHELDELSRLFILAEQFVRRLIGHKKNKADGEKTQVIPITKQLAEFFSNSPVMLELVKKLDTLLRQKENS
jgi:hypothetical protein